MKLPRDLSGAEVGNKQHNVTVPRHRDVRVGTLDGIVADVAEFLGLSKDEVRETLFE